MMIATSAVKVCAVPKWLCPPSSGSHQRGNEPQRFARHDSNHSTFLCWVFEVVLLRRTVPMSKTVCMLVGAAEGFPWLQVCLFYSLSQIRLRAHTCFPLEAKTGQVLLQITSFTLFIFIYFWLLLSSSPLPPHTAVLSGNNSTCQLYSMCSCRII